MRRFTLLLAPVALVFGLSLQLSAEDKKDPPKKDTPVEARFKALDTDKDGKLSLAEFTTSTDPKVKLTEPVVQRLTAIFKRLDKNSDKYLTIEEFKAFSGGPK